MHCLESSVAPTGLAGSIHILDPRVSPCALYPGLSYFSLQREERCALPHRRATAPGDGRPRLRSGYCPVSNVTVSISGNQIEKLNQTILGPEAIFVFRIRR